MTYAVVGKFAKRKGKEKDKYEDHDLSESGLSDLLDCRCDNKYSIEPHGKGYAIYWGRCKHRHGANLALITECGRKDLIEHFEKCLNKAD